MDIDLRTSLQVAFVANSILAALSWNLHIHHRKLVVCTLCWALAFTLLSGAFAWMSIDPPGTVIKALSLTDLLLAAGMTFALIGTISLSGRRPKPLIPILVGVFFALTQGIGKFIIHSDFFQSASLAALGLAGCISAISLLSKPAVSPAAPRSVTVVVAYWVISLCFLFRLISLIALEFGFSPLTADSLRNMFYQGLLAGSVILGIAYQHIADGRIVLELNGRAETARVLLKELRHRTKNNFVLMQSLISLQADGLSDPDAKAAFRELEGRVRTISSVYRLLSNDENAYRGSVRDYLNMVIGGLKNGPGNVSQLSFTLNAENIELENEELMRLGLVVNELATNAIKYAFPGHNNGRIDISFQTKPERHTLTVTDDGIGFTSKSSSAGADGDWDKPATGFNEGLGLSLVRSLASQLKGQLVIVYPSEGGTRWSLNYPPPSSMRADM